MTTRRPVINTNAQSSRWLIRFGGALSDLHLKLADVDIPTVTTGNTRIASDTIIDLIHPGTKLNFENLIITFFIEEGWLNYFDVYNWMRQYVLSQNTDHQIDVTLIPLDAAGRLCENAFIYKNCAPEMLTTFALDNENGTVDLTAQLSLTLEDIEIEKGRLLDLDYSKVFL